MTATFQADGLPTLIGSFPLDDHQQAMDLIMEYTPEIPLWAQLPAYKEERMLAQFTPGLPGVCSEHGKVFVDTGSGPFDDALLGFFEDYLAVLEDKLDLNRSRFVLKEDNARGFFVLIERLRGLSAPPVAVKGQITGPFTLGTGLVDQNRRAIFYDPQIRETIVKILAMKARWQVRQLSQFRRPVIIFFDEPALAGVGSSEFTSISNADIRQCLEEVFEAVHIEGGLAGIHVCANTDWALVLESSVDIVSFDAYAYFDRFVLYSDQIVQFIESGKILAWGIVPTLMADRIEEETTASLMNQWKQKVNRMNTLGIDSTRLIRQSLITPSCGTGSLSMGHMIKVLKLTREVSKKIRNGCTSN